MKTVKLYYDDCLKIMETIPTASIDLILCDLPYGTTQNEWDTIIPFDLLWEQYMRISKGAIVLFAAQPFTSLLISSNLKYFKYDWVWEKTKATGHLNAKKQPLRNKEDILVFYKKQPTYNPQMSKGEPYKNKTGKDINGSSSMTASYGKYTNKRNENTGFRYPKQILKFNTVQRNTLHPTEKPVPLLEYLIKTYTNKGDVVLDNCMGSGSTGEAAINLDRQFIGIEQELKFFTKALIRIDNARLKK